MMKTMIIVVQQIGVVRAETSVGDMAMMMNTMIAVQKVLIPGEDLEAWAGVLVMEILIMEIVISTQGGKMAETAEAVIWVLDMEEVWAPDMEGVRAPDTEGVRIIVPTGVLREVNMVMKVPAIGEVEVTRNATEDTEAQKINIWDGDKANQDDFLMKIIGEAAEVEAAGIFAWESRVNLQAGVADAAVIGNVKCLPIGRTL